MKPIILYCPKCMMRVFVPVRMEDNHVTFHPQDMGDHVCNHKPKKIKRPVR